MDEMLLLPSLSANMTEARLSRWLANEGDRIKPGDVVAEVETDKATMEIDAKIPAEGVRAPRSSGRVLASPLARRIALQQNLDLASVKGSGPGGRVIRQDVERMNGTTMAPAARLGKDSPPPAAAKQDAGQAASHGLAVSQPKNTLFFLTVDVEVDALLALQAEINARFAKSHSETLEISVDDMVVKAAAIALRHNPQLNLHIIEGKLEVCEQINIAVSLSLPKASVLPVIRHADEKGLGEISRDLKTLTEQAKSGVLKSEAACFSIASMNRRGIKSYQTFLHASGLATLAISACEQRPVIKNGQPDVATMMSATLSADRNVIDESRAAEWINSFKAILQEPLRMML